MHGVVKARIGLKGKLLGAVTKESERGSVTSLATKTSPKSDAGNTKGREKTGSTGDELGRNLERMNQNGQLNPEEMDRT